MNRTVQEVNRAVALDEIKKFIKSYNDYNGEKVFWEEFYPGESISSHKADKIEIIENINYFYLLFKFDERELQGADIYYSEWDISTQIEDNNFTITMKMI